MSYIGWLRHLSGCVNSGVVLSLYRLVMLPSRVTLSCISHQPAYRGNDIRCHMTWMHLPDARSRMFTFIQEIFNIHDSF
jgi:hypothetical protein